MSDDAPGSARLFSREEALGGVSGRRARALLFLIEYWAARLHEQAQRRNSIVVAAYDLSVYAPILMDDSYFKEKEDSVQSDPHGGLYRAFNLTREDLPPPTPAHIDANAAIWAPLVPDVPGLRAQVARLLLQKYPLTERRAVHVRAALGLDTEAVQAAYQTLYRAPLSQAFAPAPPGLGQRLRGFFGRGG